MRVHNDHSNGSAANEQIKISPGVPVEVVDIGSEPLPSKGEVNRVLTVLQGQGLQLCRAGHKCPSAAWKWLPLLGGHQPAHQAGCARRQL